MKKALITLLIVTGLAVGAPNAEAQSSNMIKLQQQISFLQEQLNNLMTLLSQKPNNKSREKLKQEKENLWNKAEALTRSKSLDFSSGDVFNEPKATASISYSRYCEAEDVEGNAEKACMINVQFLNETELIRKRSGCGNIEPDINANILEKYGFDLSGGTDSVCVKTGDNKIYEIKTDDEAKQLRWKER